MSGSHRWSPSLRAKGIVTGVAAALSISLAGSLLTYFVSRSYLVSQRESTAVTQAVLAARTAAGGLASGLPEIDAVARATRTLPGALALLEINGEWFASGVGISRDDLPSGFLARLAQGGVIHQRFSFRGKTFVVVGIKFASREQASFTALLPFTELDETLDVLRNSLSLGVVAAALAGGVLGRRLSRRVMEPLHAIGIAAADISDGDLYRRVEEPREPDLAAIARAFNEMTVGLSQRIARERQFGAMVSHELRTPLTVIRGAAEMVFEGSDSLDARSRVGLDLLKNRIDDFERILNDLIEISRYGSEVIQPTIETRSMPLLLEALIQRFGLSSELLDIQVGNQTEGGEKCEVAVDVKRFVQIFENVVRNAAVYGSGLVRLRVDADATHVRVHFDDSGPGVAAEERVEILEAFVRSRKHSGLPGSGLGLAISREHCKAMGGELSVGESPEGGARFTVSIPRSVEPI